MSKKKQPRLLLTDDLTTDADRGRRSAAVRTIAVALAARLRAAIDLVHVDDPGLYVTESSAQYRPLIDRYFAEQKSKLALASQGVSVPVRARFVTGSPVRQILSLASKRAQYELVVQGTHGRKGLPRLFLGSVAEEVIRNSSIPVLTVGPGALERASEVFKSGVPVRLLVPTALTGNAERAEDYAVSLAKRLGGEIVLLHSLHETLHPVLQTAFSAPGADRQISGYFEEIRGRAEKRLLARAKKLSRGGVQVTADLDSKTVRAADSVLKAQAATGASLVIMGTHGRSMVSGAFFGRTARDVILESSVPVLTVRSKRS